MNKRIIGQALTSGLRAGYNGKTKIQTVRRGSFELMMSHFEKDNIVYHDEWTNGGGQEIVRVEEELFTRVYGGGVVSDLVLKSLGVTKQEVIDHLIYRIMELGDKTRLFTDCQPDKINEWEYEYRVLDNDKDLL